MLTHLASCMNRNILLVVLKRKKKKLKIPHHDIFITA